MHPDRGRVNTYRRSDGLSTNNTPRVPSSSAILHGIFPGYGLMTCSSPRWAVRSHSLVCSENSLLIVGIGPILNKELKLIFRSDSSETT